jgi:hypothetical protein
VREIRNIVKNEPTKYRESIKHYKVGKKGCRASPPFSILY